MRGKKLKAAKVALEKAQCKLGTVTKLGGATAKSGKVAEQGAKAGAKLAVGAKVAVTLKPPKTTPAKAPQRQALSLPGLALFLIAGMTGDKEQRKADAR